MRPVLDVSSEATRFGTEHRLSWVMTALPSNRHERDRRAIGSEALGTEHACSWVMTALASSRHGRGGRLKYSRVHPFAASCLILAPVAACKV